MRWTVIGFLLLTCAAGCTCQTMSPSGSMSFLMSSSDFPYGSSDDWATMSSGSSDDWNMGQIGTESSNLDFSAGWSQSDSINPTQSDSGLSPTDNSWYSFRSVNSDWSNSGNIYGSMSDEWSASTYSGGMYGSVSDGWSLGSYNDGMYGSMSDDWSTGSYNDGMHGSMRDDWSTGSYSEGMYGSMSDDLSTGSYSDGMYGSMSDDWSTGSYSDGMYGSMSDDWSTGSYSDGMYGSMSDDWSTGRYSDEMYGSVSGDWSTGSYSDGMYGSVSGDWSTGSYSDGMYGSVSGDWSTGSYSDGMYGSMSDDWSTGSYNDGMYGSMSDDWSRGSYIDGMYGSMSDDWSTGSYSDGMYGSMGDDWSTGSYSDGMYGSMGDDWSTGSFRDGMYGSMSVDWSTGSDSDGMYGSMSDDWSTGSYSDGMYGSMSVDWSTGSYSDGIYGSMSDDWSTGSYIDGMYGSMSDGWSTGSYSDGMYGSMSDDWSTRSYSGSMYGSMSSGLPSTSYSGSMYGSMSSGLPSPSSSGSMYGSMSSGLPSPSSSGSMYGSMSSGLPSPSSSGSMYGSMSSGLPSPSYSGSMYGSMSSGFPSPSYSGSMYGSMSSGLPSPSSSGSMYGSMSSGLPSPSSSGSMYGSMSSGFPSPSYSGSMYGSMSSGLPSPSNSGSLWPTSGYSGSIIGSVSSINPTASGYYTSGSFTGPPPNQTWYPSGSMYPSSTWENSFTAPPPNQTWYPSGSMYPSSTWGNSFTAPPPNQTWYPSGSMYPSSTWGDSFMAPPPNQTWYPSGSMYPSSTWGNSFTAPPPNQTWYPSGSMYPNSTWGNTFTAPPPNQTWYPSGSIFPSSTWGNPFTGLPPNQTLFPSGSIFPSSSLGNNFTGPSPSLSKSPSGSIYPSSTLQPSGSSKPAMSSTGSWMVSPSMDKSSSISGSWRSTMKSSDFVTASPTSTSTIGVTCKYDDDCPPSFFCNSNPYSNNNNNNSYNNRTGQNSTFFDDYDYYNSSYLNNSNYGENMNYTGPSICDLDYPVYPNFTVGVLAKSSTEHVIVLYCKFDTESNLKYKIIWRADQEVVYTSGILTDTEAASHHVTAQNLSVDGFPLEKDFYCEVSVYVYDSVSSKYKQMVGPYYSNSIRPVEVNTSIIVMQRGGDAEIMIRINIPFPCAPGKNCTLDFKFYDPEESHGCGNSTIAFKNRHTCGERIIGTSQTVNAQRIGEKRIIVTTKNNAKYNLKSWFNLVMKAEVSGEGVETWWTGTFSQPFLVYVTDYAYYWKGNYCYSNNDPRLRTLDGYYYSLLQEGEFIMMRHKDLPVQVNLLTESCNWGFGTCSCGVIVRAGKDVYTVNHCSGEHMSAYSSLDDSVAGVASKRVLFARERASNRWQVYLPHGTVVDISVSSRSWFSWTMVNVQIIPSPSDMDKLEGLCGNFNGDYTDDLKHSNGTITPTSSYYCWWNCDGPDDFAKSWEVQDADSLLNPSNQAKLPPWDYDNYLCVCTGNNGEGPATCAANEEAACTHIDRAGYVDDYKIRSRRSAESRERRERREAFVREIEKSRYDRDINRRLMDTLQKRQSAEKRVKRSASQHRVSETEAMEICERNMDNACGVLINNTEDRVNITNRLRNCAQDTMLHNETNWGPCTCEGAKKEAEVLVTADETVNNVFITAVEELCNNNCNSKGTCSKGKCSCNSNYSLDDCSLDKRSKVKISSITGKGMCNKASSMCWQILIVTDGVVPGSYCSIRHYQFDINGTATDMGEQQIAAVYINTYEMYCPVPTTSSRRRRSTSSGGSNVASSYSISVSNDGNTFSDASSVVVLDSTCLTYTNSSGTISITLNASYCLIDGTCYANGANQTGSTCNYCDVSSNSFDWTLMSGYCLIGSTCYTNGTAKTGDSCNYCDVTLDTTAWTFDNKTESCLKSDEDKALEGYIIAIIVICTLLGVAGVVAAVYVVKQKCLASKARKAGLFDTQPNTKFTIRVEPESKDSWNLPNNPHLPKIFAEPKPGTERLPDNLYNDREMISRTNTFVPAMPWSESQNSRSPTASTIQVESQKTETAFGLAPPAPWTKPELGESSPHTSTIQIGNQEVERPRSRASVSPAPSSHDLEIPIGNKETERTSL